jgi:hypothetical protein
MMGVVAPVEDFLEINSWFSSWFSSSPELPEPAENNNP